jgi:hypothetical protein
MWVHVARRFSAGTTAGREPRLLDLGTRQTPDRDVPFSTLCRRSTQQV